MMSRAPRAWWLETKSYAPRIAPPPPRFTQQPRKKKHSFKQEPYKNEAVARFTKKIEEGDAFVIVTPEYNHGTSSVLKNALDWVYPEWNNKPVAFVSYGGVGGARAVEQLRLNAVELQMAPIRNAVHIPGEKYFQVLFGKMDAKELFASVSEQAEALITQLPWWTRALKNAR